MSGMDDFRKQLPLRQQADKPVLKYSTISSPITNPMPLFTQANLQSLKYGGISAPFRELPARNAQINMDSIAKLGYSSPTKISGNPYARPLSAKDLEGNVANPQPVLSPQRQNSNSNFFQSSMSVSPSRVQPTPFTSSASNPSIATSASIQTNSFMRPQSALRDISDSPPKSDVSGPRHSILRPPSAAGRPASQSSSNSRHSVTFADNSDSDNNNSNNYPLANGIIQESDSENENIPNGETALNSGNGKDDGSAGVALKEMILQAPTQVKAEEKVRQQTAASSEFMRKFAMNDAGAKNSIHATKMQNAQVYVLKTELLDSKQQSHANGATTVNSTNVTKSYKIEQQQYNSLNNGAYVNKNVTAGNKNNNTINASPTKISRDRDIIFRPPSPISTREAMTGSPQPLANKVRNPRYTPTKPYSEVSDLTTQENIKKIDPDEHSSIRSTKTEATAIHIPTDTVSNSKDHFTSPGLITKPPKSGFARGGTQAQPQVTNASKQDGTAKKMPVTNTVTGTIFYRKGSKGEELLHEQRPKADGAPSKAQKLEKAASVSNDGEEWEDDEDFEGESDSYPNSERLPGDGEAFEEEFDDDDDGIDNLDDDFVDGSDDESAYSITSGTSLSRQSSARARVHSATKRLMHMSIKDGDRPSTATRRPTSAKSFDGELQPALSTSLFTNVPPTVNFVPEGDKVEQLPWDIRKLLKWRLSPITPNIVKSTIGRSGFRISKKNYDWLGCWGKHMKAQGFKGIREYQKMNHFPGSFQIGRKDRLWRNLSKMQCHFGKRDFGFFPQTYVLPFDMKHLKRAWEDGGTKQKWIIKPPASARGIGIKVIHKWQQIPKRRPVIVQRYLSKPYLINESKFDLRIYVYVTSYDPLRIYVFEDGLVRFASQKYSSSMKNLSNKYMHLTNYSINKKNNEYQANTDETVCQGHKWGLKALWVYMKKQGINTGVIWENIKDVVIKTIMCAESAINSMIKANVRRRYCIHELFGFDIFLDENLKPWIIEVNISPSLHSNSQLDINIKGNMIKDLFNIAGFLVPDKNDVVPVGVSDNCRAEPSNDICMDKRLSNQPYSNDERAKHTYYCQKHTDEAVRATILDILTPDDIRMLIETLDEDNHRGQFQRVFPSTSSHRYLKHLEQPRYYNLLLDAWCHKYHKYESRGISLLDQYCRKGLHLENPTSDPHHQWSPPTSTPRTQSAPMGKSRADADLRSKCRLSPEMQQLHALTKSCRAKIDKHRRKVIVH
ncbi:tubulin monoglutamylase TTLL4-like isoform X2 [Lineus longissimus]|uniref:tubulin monoglutamylase TTLL4-like isoform X2 n=1 Tax=Lineus longissimus TaxID=88925 RepID=UPI002B4EAAD5